MVRVVVKPEHRRGDPQLNRRNVKLELFLAIVDAGLRESCQRVALTLADADCITNRRGAMWRRLFREAICLRPAVIFDAEGLDEAQKGERGRVAALPCLWVSPMGAPSSLPSSHPRKERHPADEFCEQAEAELAAASPPVTLADGTVINALTGEPNRLISPASGASLKATKAVTGASVGGDGEAMEVEGGEGGAAEGGEADGGSSEHGGSSDHGGDESPRSTSTSGDADMHDASAAESGEVEAVEAAAEVEAVEAEEDAEEEMQVGSEAEGEAGKADGGEGGEVEGEVAGAEGGEQGGEADGDAEREFAVSVEGTKCIVTVPDGVRPGETITVEDLAGALTLSLDEEVLKRLCIANEVHCSSKATRQIDRDKELLQRLQSVAKHGRPGPCPRCESILRVVSDDDGLRLECPMWRGGQGHRKPCGACQCLDSSLAGLPIELRLACCRLLRTGHRGEQERAAPISTGGLTMRRPAQGG